MLACHNFLQERRWKSSGSKQRTWNNRADSMSSWLHYMFWSDFKFPHNAGVSLKAREQTAAPEQSWRSLW